MGPARRASITGVKAALKPLCGLYRDQAAAEFGPTGFKAVRQVMIETGLTRQGINSRMKRVTRTFKWSASEGKIPASVYETLRLISSLKAGRANAPESEPVKPVDDDTVDATLPHLPPIVADMVRVQLLTGCRPGEVCKLTPRMIDRSGEIWVATLAEHKTRHHEHDRTIYIGPKAQQILATYIDREGDTCLFRPCDVVEARRAKGYQLRKTPLSCGNRPGRRSGGLKGSRAKKTAGTEYTTASYRRAIHNACDKAFPPPPPLARREGESDSARRRRLNEAEQKQLARWQSQHRWSPNRLRHSRGTAVRKQFGLEAAQVVLGHKNADVTQIYAERNREKAIEVVKLSG